MPVAKNQLNLNLTAEQLAGISTAMATIAAALAPLQPISTTERRRLMKMGYKSESFVREAQGVLASYPGAFPAGLDADQMAQDLAVREVFVPLQVQLEELLRRVADTNLVAGGDLMSSALVIYRNVKSHGESMGLQAVAERMKQRFDRPGLPPGEAPAAPAPNPGPGM